MSEKEYIKKAKDVLSDIFGDKKKLSYIIAEYYDKNVNEKTKKNTSFFKDMKGIIETAIKNLYHLKDELEDPDSIERLETR